MTALVWLRRDLRMHDHPALTAAFETSERVVPVFCLDDRLLGGRHASGPRTQFLLECLEDLADSLRQRGSGLILRAGAPEAVIPQLAAEVGAGCVHLTADVGPYAARRDRMVAQALARDGVGVAVHPGHFAVDDPAAVRTSANRPYTVFTPFHRAWLRAGRRNALPAPTSLPPLPSTLRVGRIPSLERLGLRQEVSDPAPGGEHAARRAVRRFLDSHVTDYGSGRDGLTDDGVSRLSPYLHFGCLSARELEADLDDSPGAQAFRRQLCWRDFYAQVLAQFPGNARSEFQERYRGHIRWSGDRRRFEAWCDGRTGYPVVDAGMRQLRREGWMHNRARLVVGSFLTKDLGIDWRWGERWFMRLLIDGDEASNNGNWQWIASVGVDPQPPFRRMYNPVRQQARLDPAGVYVRRYVPELREVPDEYLAEPWTMSTDLQRQVGCVIGEDYPEPIVDHAAARREALERYADAAR
jgi:deoxyribodipyrimidine photo-lyase